MTGPALDSMLLASTDPTRLADWYAAVLDPAEDVVVNGYRVLRFGHVHLLIDRRDDIGPTAVEPARIILNFDVRDARALVARMESRGVRWVSTMEDRDGSVFATAADPDGNYVQLIELSDADRTAMAGA